MIKKLLLSLLEMNSEEIVGLTGKKCTVSGIYRVCDEYIALSKGEIFPPVFNDAAVWILVVSV